MAHIKILSDEIVNQIAAGEIIERPASIIKELVENSIDAGSSEICIFLQSAGREKLVVEDNGAGINRDELPLAVKRHATSKLTGANLFDITSYGFRGEALPSIASISQFCIESDETSLRIDFGGVPSITNSVVSSGTRITVQNIFDRIPARLKFLKSDSIELSHCLELIENFAITHPLIKFSVRDDIKILLSFTETDRNARITEVVGDELLSRSVYIKEADDVISVEGFLGHPVDSRYSQSSQKIFINNRWVKDKTISLAVKTAFKDLLPAGRFATCVLFVTINPFYLDINVSPTKSEVRFRDSHYVQQFVTHAIKKNLNGFDRISLQVDDSRITIPRKLPGKIQSINPTYSTDNSAFNTNDIHDNLARKLKPTEGFSKSNEKVLTPNNIIHFNNVNPNRNNSTRDIEDTSSIDVGFWGEPIAQIFDTYIICKTTDELIIIDQHAVHEKITMEKILKNINIKNVQYLIKPEILNLTKQQLRVASDISKELSQCGFVIDIGATTITVLAIPTVINVSDIRQFLYDVFSKTNAISGVEIKDTIRLKIANIACHNSIRAGRKLTIDEMKSVLLEMQRTQSIHQCNHHRPSFVKISKKQFEKIFERS